MQREPAAISGVPELWMHEEHLHLFLELFQQNNDRQYLTTLPCKKFWDAPCACLTALHILHVVQ
jgi:hypothetical protein